MQTAIRNLSLKCPGGGCSATAQVVQSRRRAPPPALKCPGGCSATAQVVQSSSEKAVFLRDTLEFHKALIPRVPPASGTPARARMLRRKSKHRRSRKLTTPASSRASLLGRAAPASAQTLPAAPASPRSRAGGFPLVFLPRFLQSRPARGRRLKRRTTWEPLPPRCDFYVA